MQRPNPIHDRISTVKTPYSLSTSLSKLPINLNMVLKALELQNNVMGGGGVKL